MNILGIASVVETALEQVEGVKRIITTVEDLVSGLTVLAGHLKTVPPDLTLQDAQQQLQAAQESSKTQDQAIRDQANAALADNAREGTETPQS